MYIILNFQIVGSGRGLTQKQGINSNTRTALGDLNNSSSVLLPSSKALKSSVTKSKKVHRGIYPSTQ